MTNSFFFLVSLDTQHMGRDGRNLVVLFFLWTISLRLVVVVVVDNLTNQNKISGDKIGNKERQTQRDPMIV
jgi:hypothetical protein